MSVQLNVDNTYIEMFITIKYTKIDKLKIMIEVTIYNYNNYYSIISMTYWHNINVTTKANKSP